MRIKHFSVWFSRFVPASWKKSRKDHLDLSITPNAYIKMILDMDEIPLFYNILASLFPWLVLAGYLVFPGTFTSLRTSTSMKDMAAKNEIGKVAYNAVQNASLVGIATVCCTIGLCGEVWIWWQQKPNFLWLVHKVFL